VSLRFFRKKAGSARAAPKEVPIEPPPVKAAQPPAATRRRASTSTRGAKAEAAPAAEPAKEAPPAEEKKKPTRRGTRGGVRRRKAAAAANATASDVIETVKARAPTQPPPAETPVAIPARPLRASRRDGQPPTLEAVLEQLNEREVMAIKDLQSTLSAIESRLVSIDRRTVERPRLAIFVDVPNVIYAAERVRVKIDFAKLIELLSRDRELVRASAYAPISDDPSAPLEGQRFVQPFVGLGYRIVSKPLKRYADGSMKANFDVELAMDVLMMADRLDIVSLVSGDGDFRRLVELVASKGVRVQVVAFGSSTAAELRAVADEYIDLQAHLAELRVT